MTLEEKLIILRAIKLPSGWILDETDGGLYWKSPYFICIFYDEDDQCWIRSASDGYFVDKLNSPEEGLDDDKWT